MTLLRTIIVDDEPLARRGLKLRLEHNSALELVAECNNGVEGPESVNAGGCLGSTNGSPTDAN